MCIVAEVMKKQEEYARGWAKLYPTDPKAAEMADYAIALQRLGNQHWEHCCECQRGPVAA